MPERKLSERTALWVAVAGVLGAVCGAAITGAFNFLAHQNDVDAKMIELSVGILRAEPTTETTPLREWAIDVIDKRTNFKFNAVQRATLLKQPLPYKVYWDPSILDMLRAPPPGLRTPPPGTPQPNR